MVSSLAPSTYLQRKLCAKNWRGWSPEGMFFSVQIVSEMLEDTELQQLLLLAHLCPVPEKGLEAERIQSQVVCQAKSQPPAMSSLADPERQNFHDFS